MKYSFLVCFSLFFSSIQHTFHAASTSFRMTGSTGPSGKKKVEASRATEDSLHLQIRTTLGGDISCNCADYCLDPNSSEIEVSLLSFGLIIIIIQYHFLFVLKSHRFYYHFRHKQAVTKFFSDKIEWGIGKLGTVTRAVVEKLLVIFVIYSIAHSSVFQVKRLALRLPKKRL